MEGTETMRKFVAAALLLLIGGAGIYWYTGNNLAFKPAQGDTRQFILEQYTELQPSSGRRKGPVRIRIESLLRSEVLAANDGVVTLESRALRSEIWEQDRLHLDTERVPEQDGQLQAMAALLKAGVIEQVANDGRVLETAYVNEEALATLTEDAYLPDIFRDMLRRELSVMSTYQPGQSGFPSGPLRAGLSWQTPSRNENGQIFSAVHYEVSRIDEESVSIQFRPIISEALAEGQKTAVEIEGYIELERKTGWPLRAAIGIYGAMEQNEKPIAFQTTMALTQAGVEPRFDAYEAWFHAYMAFAGRDVDTTNPYFETYFLPPFSPGTPEESLTQLEKTLLWFGTREIDGRLGLEFQSGKHNSGILEFAPVSAVRLLDADGEPVVDPVPLDPRYALNASGFTGYRRVPFLASELTSDQLSAVATVELDMAVTKPGKLYSQLLTPESPSLSVEELGLQFSVEGWNSKELQVRVHQANGSLPDYSPLIVAYPVDGQGKYLSRFAQRLTHTLFEPLRNEFPKATGEADRWVMAEQFAHRVMNQLLLMPMEERTGDWIHELKAGGDQNIEGVRVHIYAPETEQRTFVAPNALATLKGGPVVGERTLDEYDAPVLEFSTFELDDVRFDGIQQNWLKIRIPDKSVGRCDISLVGEPSYQGAPITLSASENNEFAQLLFASDTYSDRPERNLMTTHGLTYFYDLEVAIDVDCITDVVLHSGPIPDNAQLTMVDSHTLQLSQSLHQTLSKLQHRFNLEQLPLIAYNRDGGVLEPLSSADAGSFAEDQVGTEMSLRFWGEIAEVRYPTGVKREARQVTVKFPPLP